MDVDVASDIAEKYKIMAMPTFLFFKNGQMVERFSGASGEKLRQVIKDLM